MPVLSNSTSDFQEMEDLCKKGLDYQEAANYQAHSLGRLHARLAQNILNVLTLICAAALLIVGTRVRTVRIMDWEAMLAVVVLFLSLLGIPYQYGKSLRVKPVRLAAIYTAPSDFKTGLVLFDNDAGITLAEAKQREIWFLPRAKITQIQIMDVTDVLGYFIKEGTAKPQDEDSDTYTISSAHSSK